LVADTSCTGSEDTRAAEIPDAFLRELRALLPPDQIDEDDHERRQRGKPWSSYHQLTNYPRVIVSPSSTEQVSSVVKLCSTYHVPVIPFGGGTSLEGQTLTPQGGVSIDFSHMREVLELNQDDLDVRVQAGMGYIELNELLRPLNLWFPLDPGPGTAPDSHPLFLVSLPLYPLFLVLIHDPSTCGSRWILDLVRHLSIP
jgi:hypothetical protein